MIAVPDIEKLWRYMHSFWHKYHNVTDR